MSWLYSRVLVEAYSAANCSDGAPSAQLRSTPTAEAYWYAAKTKESSSLSQFGMTCEPSMLMNGRDLLTWFLRVSHASVTQPLATYTAANTSTDGQIRQELLRVASQGSSGSKMFRAFLGMAGTLCCWHWPTWGTMLGGACFRVSTPPQTLHSKESVSLLWRRPAATDWRRRDLYWPSVQKSGNPLCLPQQLAQRGHRGYLNPQFPNYLMGWPPMWANLRPLDKARFQQWLDSHGRH